MKFKKAFAVILAVAMVITLVPTMAFATTSNVVSGVQTVAKNTEFDTTLELEVKNDPANWEKDGNKIIQEVTLSVENAKWAYGTPGSKETSTKLTADAFLGSNDAVAVTVTGGKNADVPSATVKYCSPTSVTLEIDESTNLLEKSDVIQLTLNLKSTTKTGDVTVEMDSTSGDITAGTYTVATVVDKTTVTTVPDADTEDLALVTIRNGNQEASDIVIRESSAAAVSGAQKFTITLPKEVSWNENMDASQVSGSLLNNSSATVTIDSDNNRILTVEFTAASNSNVRRTLTISPLVDTTKNAKEGDLVATIRNVTGDISNASNLVIAKIGQADVGVYVDEEDYTEGQLPSLYSGLKVDNEKQDADAYDQDDIAVITIKENKAGNLVTGKYIDFTFDSQVQLLGNVRVELNGSEDNSNLEGTSAEANLEKNRSSFGYRVGTLNASGENELKFYIPLTVEAGFDGDVNCVVSGAAAGIEKDVTVKVATAKPVIKLDTKVSEVRTGVQNQKINDVVITETEIGSLDAALGAKEVVVTFPFALAKKPVVKVTDGDMEIKDVEKDKDKVTFTVDAASVDKASTITISDIEISLDRQYAEGGYDIEVHGSAVIDNGDFNDKKFDDCYTAEDSIKVITPADSEIIDNKVDAKFVVGEKKYTNNGVEVAMDVATFIQNNRTYVPVRYLANALGVTDENIAWDSAKRTVTLTGPNTVVKLAVGSKVITTSTDTITADVPVIVKDNRTYLPARFVANAFGADVAWNAVTRTVIITK